MPHDVRAAGAVMQDERVKVTAARVDHPPVVPAFAYRFDCPDRSIVISDDTRASAKLVKHAQGADVLVHEVRHLPSIDALAAGETTAKTLRDHLLVAHSTTEQVGRLSTEAGVETLCCRTSCRAANRSSGTRSGSIRCGRTSRASSPSAAIC